MSASESGSGGFKEVIAEVRGEGAFSRMKFESGVHRVQRVPVTESAGRIHTSTATVAVLPAAEDVDVHIDPNDLQIDVYRSSGPGGQSVNTRSEEHTSELQSRQYLVCRLLLEKKKKYHA